MDFSVYIRPLTPNDAKIAYKWRNNPKIWEYTKGRPTQYITEEIERKWIENCLKKDDEYRFAICLQRTDQYIGNIQLLQVKDGNANMHLFIGEERFWGKGIAKSAIKLVFQFGFLNLGLQCINLDYNKDNLAAMTVYKKLGFQEAGLTDYGFTRMFITRMVYDGMEFATSFVQQVFGT